MSDSSSSCPSGPVLEDLVQAILVGWSGLRLYIEKRKAGSPPDPTMDTLLGEVLRSRCPRGVDVACLLDYLLQPAPRSPLASAR